MVLGLVGLVRLGLISRSKGLKVRTNAIDRVDAKPVKRFMFKVCKIFVRGLAMANTKIPEVVFILGGPGAGKGTQCNYIVKKYGYVHLSAGDLLREERAKPGSKFGELIENHILNGTIVPVEITCSLLERAMQDSDTTHKRFLIDGFPRNEDNVKGWNKAMAEKTKLKGVFFFECSREKCMERCLNRGKKGSGRSDDNEETLRKRLDNYIIDTVPIIEHYEKLGLVYKFNSMQNPNQVFQNVQNAIELIGW